MRSTSLIFALLGQILLLWYFTHSLAYHHFNWQALTPRRHFINTILQLPISYFLLQILGDVSWLQLIVGQNRVDEKKRGKASQKFSSWQARSSSFQNSIIIHLMSQSLPLSPRNALIIVQIAATQSFHQGWQTLFFSHKTCLPAYY